LFQVAGAPVTNVYFAGTKLNWVSLASYIAQLVLLSQQPASVFTKVSYVFGAGSTLVARDKTFLETADWTSVIYAAIKAKGWTDPVGGRAMYILVRLLLSQPIA
jgi:hypothetical protein